MGSVNSSMSHALSMLSNLHGGCPDLSCNQCFTISGEEFNDNPQHLWDFCNGFPQFEKCCTDMEGIVGYGACDYFYDSPDASYTICRGACRDPSSCWYIAESALEEPPTVKIGEEACTGFNACNSLGRFASSVDVGSCSCIGDQPCYQAGCLAGSTTIGNEACIDDYSCFDVGLNAHPKFLGPDPNAKLVIGNDACNGEASCFCTGMHSSFLTIEDEACVGDWDCLNCDDGWSGPLTIKASMDGCILFP